MSYPNRGDANINAFLTRDAGDWFSEEGVLAKYIFEELGQWVTGYHCIGIRFRLDERH